MDMTTFVLAKNYADKQIEKAEMGDIELDNTLTKQGFAADAKAVGDKLNSIKIPAIDSTLSVEGAAADAKTVGEALKNIDIPEQVQADWDQIDSTSTDFIKNKPFGIVPKTVYCNTTLSYHEEWGEDGMTLSYVWDDDAFGTKGTSLGAGNYAITLGSQTEIIYYEGAYGNGTLQTSFMTIEWTYNRWIVESPLQFRITSSPFEGLESPAKFSIMKVTVKKIDNTYIDFPQSDWNETDETKSSYIQNRTHYDESFGKWEELARVRGERYYDEMDGYRYKTMTEAEVNVDIQVGYEYSILLYDANDDMGNNPGYKPDNGDKVRPYYKDGPEMEGWDCISYNDVEYKDNIGIIILPYATSGLAIYRHQILGPMKQLDEKFIPNTIARLTDIPDGNNIQGDWNQNDETAPDYIKNRTHYGTLTRIDYVEEERLSFNFDDMEYRWSMASMPIINKPDYNSSVIVVINGSDYECDVEERWDVKWDPVQEDDIDYNYRYIQCGDYEFSENPDENVYMVKYNGEPDWDTYDHYATIEIYTQEGEIKQLDDMYIPDTIARKVDLLELDQSLSVAGYAADARAVGNMFRNNPVVQSDWDQTDNNQMDYIKHKPFGYEVDYGGQQLAKISWTHISTDNQMGTLSLEWDQKDFIRLQGRDESLTPGLHMINFRTSDPYYVEITGEYGQIITAPLITFKIYDEMGTYIDILSDPPAEPTGSATLSITPVVLKKIDNQFINSANTVDINDNRPISSAAVAEALANIGGNPDAPSGGDSAEQVQADWNETDSANPAYIKNKPFGVIQSDPILDFELGWTVQDTEDGMGSERFWNTPTISNDAIRTPVPAGQYRVSFFNQSTIVELTASSGTIETDFITLSYYQDRWTNMTIYTITSEPPTWESGSSQLIIAPVEIKKIDNVYLDLDSTQADWAQTDSTSSDYIKNKPFGPELGDIYCEETLSWSEEYDDDQTDYISQWDNNTFIVYKWLNPGYYQIDFNGQTAITKAENGIIQTDFIALSYSGDGMDGFTFTVISRPPDGQDSAVLTITPVNIIKLDPTYLPTPIADWSQSDKNSIGYIQNRTHYDEAFGESEQIVYKLGDYSYDDMGERRYEKFTEVEVNTSIGNYMYIFKTTTNTWDPAERLYTSGSESIRSYYYDDGMNSGYAITYNGVEYKDYIDTIIFSDGITGLEISRAEILSELKQLDEKFIPNIITRAYTSGDTTQIYLVTAGVISSDGSQVEVSIPMSKPRIGINTAFWRGEYELMVKCDGQYLIGDNTSFAQAESVDFDLTYPDVIIAKFALPTIKGTEPLFGPFDLTSVILKGTLYFGNNDM